MNPKTNMSSLRPPHFSIPPTTFPPVGPIPPNLPIRLDPHSPKLAALDSIYDKTTHPVLDARVQDAEQDETKSKEAMRILEQHIKDRMPYVQLASRQLQSVMGTRNERVFDLPFVDRSHLSPALRSLYSKPEGLGFGGSLDAGSTARAAARRNGVGEKERRKGSALDAMFMPKSPLGPGVDKNTGVGLREFLLSMGKGSGMRKRECDSITICDFTPNMRTGEHRNKLLGHWSAAKEKGERIDVYEVDLQTTSVNIETGKATPVTESWIWFLISRPVLSLSATDASTSVRVGPEAPILSPESIELNAPYSKYAPSPSPSPPSANPQPQPQPPPNFPHPIPTSWVVFACPLAHVTPYPESVEKVEGENSAVPPSPTPTGPKYPFLSASTPPKKIHKRADYDLSHFGIPIFEFSSRDLFSGSSERIEFLSVDGIGGWDEKDFYNAYTEEEYRDRANEAIDRWEGETNEYDEHMAMDAPSPNRGVWWEKFYGRMHEDSKCWKRVKHAMGRGKCRVVARWAENELVAVEEDEDMGVGSGGGIGLGIKGELGLELLAGSKSRAKERVAAGAGVGKHQRSTKSENRRRSALGSEVMAVSGNGGPAGRNEGAKARLGAARSVEKEKLKVRKR